LYYSIALVILIKIDVSKAITNACINATNNHWTKSINGINIGNSNHIRFLDNADHQAVSNHKRTVHAIILPNNLDDIDITFATIHTISNIHINKDIIISNAFIGIYIIIKTKRGFQSLSTVM